MTTIAKLVAEMEVDPRRTRAGLRESASDIRNFKRQMEQEMARLPVLNIVSPTMMNRLLKETKGDFDKATEAANRLNDGVNRIRSSIATMRAQSARTASLGQAGLIAQLDPFQGAGGAAAAASSNAASSVASVAAARTAQGVSRTQAAMFSLVFTIGNLGEQLAAAETKWQKLDRTIGTSLQTIANVAVFFGPGGILLAAVAAAGNFLSSFWTQQREEADRTARAWTDSLARMRKGRDIGGAGELSQELFSGPGGIQQLQRQIADQRAIIARAEQNLRGALLQSARQTALNTIGQLERQLATVTIRHREAIGVVNDLARAEGERAAIGLRVAQEQAALEAPAKTARGLVQQASALQSLYKTLNEQQREAPDVATRLLSVYDRMTESLRGMKDQWDELAVGMKTSLAELEKSDVIALLRGGVPRRFGVTAVTTGAAPLQQAPVRGQTLPVGDGVSVSARVQNALEPIVNAIAPAFQALATSVMPVSLMFEALRPAVEVLSPLITSLVAPFAAVFQVIATGLEPAFRLLFPIVKAGAIVLSIFFEVAARVTAGIARVFGNVFSALGSLIRRIPGLGGLGKSIQNLGKSLLSYSDETRRSADEMARTRKQLQQMQFGQTANDITGLGIAARTATEALTNVPEIWKVGLSRWRAAEAGFPAGVPGGTRPPGLPPTPRPVPGETAGSPAMGGMVAGSAIVFHGDVTIVTQARNAQELLSDLEAAANGESLRTTGRTGGWRNPV